MESSIGIGDLAALLTAAGVTIYVLGLLGLAIPIRRVFTGEISTAWLAVSLVSKTVVAGQGVRIWLLWTSVNAALVLLLTTGLRVLPDSLKPFAFLGGPAALVLLLSLRAGIAPTATRENRTFSYYYLYISYVVGLLCVYYAFFLFNPDLGPPEEMRRPMVPALASPIGDDVNLIVGIITVFIGGFFLGLPTAIRAAPRLPEVAISVHPNASIEGIPDYLTGWLVAHSDAFWHLFVLVEDQWELMSIPDDKVGLVRIRPGKAASIEDTTLQEATTPGKGEMEQPPPRSA